MCIGKAKKRSPREEPQIESHTISTGIYTIRSMKGTNEEGMKVVFKKCAEAIRKRRDLDYQLAQINKTTRRVLKDHGVSDWENEHPDIPDGAPPIVEDSLSIIMELKSLTDLAKSDDERRLVLKALRIGGYLERIAVRPFEPAAKYGREHLFHWRGSWVEASLLEREIMEFMSAGDDRLLDEFGKACWEGSFDCKTNRGKVDQAIHKLNKKLQHAQPSCSYTFHIMKNRIRILNFPDKTG